MSHEISPIDFEWEAEFDARFSQISNNLNSHVPETRLRQELFSQIGMELGSRRTQQALPIGKIAGRAGCSPMDIIYWEHGAMTQEEFIGHIDLWVSALNLDPREYKLSLGLL